ncbi:MAG: RNA polymerase sigma factor [Planctomycetaceae bacterium]
MVTAPPSQAGPPSVPPVMSDDRFAMDASDEQRLLALMSTAATLRGQLEQPVVRRTAEGHARQPTPLETELLQVEGEILEIVAGYLRASLPGLMAKRFGHQVVAKVDPVHRFSAMLSEFFVRVLETRPDPFWRARTALDLRRWATTVMGNLMCDALRHQRSQQKRTEELWMLLQPLVVERNRRFRKASGQELDDDVLELLEIWRNADDSRQRAVGQVLYEHYVVGTPYREIAETQGCSVETIYNRRDEGLNWLEQRRRRNL